MRIRYWSSDVCSSDLVQVFPAMRVLGRYAGRALIVVATARLGAAQRKHEGPRRVAPVGTDGKRSRHVERRGDFAGRANADAIAQTGTHQGVVHQQQTDRQSVV